MAASVWSVAIKVTYIILQFGVNVLLARLLGPERLGVYGFIMALVHLLVVGAQFGFPVFLVRTVAVARAHDDNTKIHQLIAGSTRLILILSLMSMSCMFLVTTSGVVAVDLSVAVIVAGMALIPILALSGATSGVIRGLGHVIMSQLSADIIRPSLFLLWLVLFLVIGEMLTPELALVLHGLSAGLALLLGRILLFRYVPASSRRIGLGVNYTDLLKLSAPFMLLAGVQVLNHQTDTLMLGLLTDQESVGQYRVAVQAADGLGIALYGISITIGPRIATLHSKKDWLGLQRLLVSAHRIGGAIMLPIGLAFAAFGDSIIRLVFGHQYLPAASAFAMLALGKMVYGTVGFSGMALSMLGRAGVAALLAGTTVILNVVLNLWLIPGLGIRGAATATAVSEFVVNAAGLYWMYRTYGRNFSAFARLKNQGNVV